MTTLKSRNEIKMHPLFTNSYISRLPLTACDTTLSLANNA